MQIQHLEHSTRKVALPFENAFRISLRVFFLMLLLPNVGHATGIIINKGSTFNGTALTALNVTLVAGANNATPLATQAATYMFSPPPPGAALPLVNTITDAKGMLSFGPAPLLAIPPAAAPSGGSAAFDAPNGPNPGPVTVKWSNARWLWQSNIFLAALGMPGNADQSFQLLGLASLMTSDPTIGPRNVSVSSSAFDVTYINDGSGLYTATINDNNSGIQLNDGSLIDLPQGTTFGTIQYLTNSSTSASGTFDFSALGSSGTWNWDAGTNLTTGRATSIAGFGAPTIAVVTPEPSPGLLLGTGLAGLAISWYRVRPRKRAIIK